MSSHRKCVPSLTSQPVSILQSTRQKIVPCHIRHSISSRFHFRHYLQLIRRTPLPAQLVSFSRSTLTTSAPVKKLAELHVVACLIRISPANYNLITFPVSHVPFSIKVDSDPDRNLSFAFSLRFCHFLGHIGPFSVSFSEFSYQHNANPTLSSPFFG